MDQRQQELRRAAAQEFFESLDELQAMSQNKHRPAGGRSPQLENNIPSHSSETELIATETTWEQAAADIEAFFQSQDSPIEGS